MYICICTPIYVFLKIYTYIRTLLPPSPPDILYQYFNIPLWFFVGFFFPLKQGDFWRDYLMAAVLVMEFNVLLDVEGLYLCYIKY